MPKIIAVIGATGNQGASVISTLLANEVYTIRGITRNVASAKATILSARGVQMVTADLNDEASLVAAFSGVSAIYAITDFFEPFSKHGPQKAISIEVAQGKAIADAALATPTLEHFIWSTLPNGKLLSGGRWIVPHFEGKNQIDAYIASKPALLAKTTFLWNAYYASNLHYPMFTPSLVKTAGKYAWLQPTPASTAITILGDPTTNVGPFVSAILRHPERTLPGRFVLAAVETMTQGEVLEAWGRATGKETVYVEISLQDFDRLWPVWGMEMGLMMKMWEELGEKSWGGEDVVTKADLDITETLVGMEEYFGAADWGFP